MHLALLTDVHGNLPALEAVLADIDDGGPEEIWSLGDIVGYGAQPNECAALVAERCSVSLVGNHDLAVLGKLDLETFSPTAAAAVEWTQGNCSGETLSYIRGLSPEDTSHEVAIYHASPRDPVWEYVLWPDQAAECIEAQAKRISFVGHSHVALFFTDRDEDGVRGAQAGAGTELDLEQGRWLINPGSVGQPRDGDPRAAWLQLDTTAWKATYRRVSYEIDRAASAIEAANLPEALAKRLYVGQ